MINISADLFVFQASHQCIYIIIFVVLFQVVMEIILLLFCSFVLGHVTWQNICICVCRNWINTHICLTTQLCYNPAWIVFVQFEPNSLLYLTALFCFHIHKLLRFFISNWTSKFILETCLLHMSVHSSIPRYDTETETILSVCSNARVFY